MQMTFSLAWITGRGVRRKARVWQRRGQRRDELSWATEGKSVVTDCFRERLTDSFSFLFLFFDTLGLSHQIKLRQKVSGHWWNPELIMACVDRWKWSHQFGCFPSIPNTREHESSSWLPTFEEGRFASQKISSYVSGTNRSAPSSP